MHLHNLMPEWDQYDVLLDGFKVENAFEADNSQGKVWVNDPFNIGGYKILLGNVDFIPRSKLPDFFVMVDGVAVDAQDFNVVQGTTLKIEFSQATQVRLLTKDELLKLCS